ncbi:heparinase II/III domain-containing protein [Ruania alba]
MLPRRAWYSENQILTLRERSGSTDGLFLAAKGGGNGDSHNHNDVGSFIVGLDGRPLIVDVGVERYTAKTFGPERYDIWTMQSSSHNLPEVDGVQQGSGPEFHASNVVYSPGETEDRLVVDIDGAYPKRAGMVAWTRTFRFCRLAPCRAVGDPESSTAAIRVEDSWSLNGSPTSLVWHLMCAVRPKVRGRGRIGFQGSAGRSLELDFDGSRFKSEIDEVALQDPQLRRVWGEKLFRIRIIALENARSMSGVVSMGFRSSEV